MTDAFPGGETFRDMVVVPYAGLLDRWQDGDWHRGGPAWPDWEQQVSARHCRGGRPMDIHPDAPEGPLTHLDALAWGGGIDVQFGHQVADFSARLLPTMLARPDLPIAFASKPERGWQTLADTPSFFRAILDWFGLPPERLHLVNEPSLVGELFVVPQGEQLDGPGPSAAYLDALDENADRQMGEAPARHETVLYVSRAGIPARFAGEVELERALGAAGVRIMRPETLPLPEQLRAYRESRRMVFAEGSAIHTLQLLGRIDTEVGVLVRRGGKRIARPSLLPRVRSVAYEDATHGLLHGIAPSGRYAHHRGLSLLREEEVPAAFERLGIDLSRTWDAAGFRRSRDEDVLAWIDVQARDTERHGVGSVEMMLEGLSSMGLPHLVDEAATRLEPLRAQLAAATTRPLPARPDQPTLLFMHIPRTAGAALRTSLEGVVPAGERRSVYDHLVVDGAITSEAFAGLPEAERAALSLVAGDFGYGFHQHIPGPARYVTMLRHPVSRIVSLYQAGVRAAAARGETEPPLEAWVFEGRRIEADNAMVRAISGRVDVPFGACTDDMLEQALAHIEADFVAVLSRGSMARSLTVLGKAIRVTLPPAPVLNADPEGDEALKVDKPLRMRLRQLNRLDVALFRRFADSL